MGLCPGQAPMTMSSFCRFRVKTVPSEEDSASCEVLAGLFQSLIAISNANCAFFFGTNAYTAFKNVPKGNYVTFSLFRVTWGIMSKITK